MIMKKLLLMFVLLFTVSTSLMSCRENPNEATESELNNEELNVNDNQQQDLRRDLDNNPEESATEVPREEGPGTIQDDL